MVRSEIFYIFALTILYTTISQRVVAEVKETQHAECILISGDIRASAEASVSRKLEGFCATDHLSRAFANLENRLLNEINHLRSMINLLLPPLYQQHIFAQPQPQLYEPSPESPSTTVLSKLTNETSQLPEEVSNRSSSSTLPTIRTFVDRQQSDSSDVKEVTTLIAEDITEHVTEKQLKFRPVQKKVNERNKSRIRTGPREFEIHKLNNTILSGNDLQIFSYYWKIEQFSVKLKENISTLNSPIFSMAGLFLQIKVNLNHLNRDYLHLQLEQVPINNQMNNSNIILRTSDMFKKIGSKVSFKHQIVILNQVTPASDLISPEFAATSQGFLVPSSTILSGPYSKGDNLLIKVVITL